MKITKRDLEICVWANRFGYATAEQIARKFGISKQITYRRLRYMEISGHIIRERILFGESGVYRPTAEILGLAEAKLAPIRKISLGTYKHTLAVTNICLALQTKYPGARIITEREIRASAGQSGVGLEGHFPDAVMVVFGKQFAIEYEQSQKGKNRRRKIKNHFLRGNIPGVGSIAGVWYIVPEEQRALAQQLDAEFSNSDSEFFRVFLWPGFEKIEIAETEIAAPKPMHNFRRIFYEKQNIKPFPGFLLCNQP